MSDAGTQASAGKGPDLSSDVHPPKKIAQTTATKGAKKARQRIGE